MFKVLVLQTLDTRSDDQTEYQPRDRRSFMRFVGLGLHDPVPDAKTIWLFREQLMRADAVERLFQRFDTALRDKGLLAPRPAHAGRPCGTGSSALRSMGGSILDATIVQARPARLTVEEKSVIDHRGTPSGWSPARRAQIDRDARWTLKRGRKRQPPDGSSHRQAVEIAVPACGSKSHIGINRAHGLIRTWAVIHAAAHDAGQLAGLLDAENTASGVWADTAYHSAVNLAAPACATRSPTPSTTCRPNSTPSWSTTTTNGRTEAIATWGASRSKPSTKPSQLDASKNLAGWRRWRLNEAMPTGDAHDDSAGFLRPRGTAGTAVGEG